MSWLHQLRSMLPMLLLLPLVAACSSDEGSADAAALSPCERTCITIRQDLIDNFGVDPQRVDCTDPMWKGDCQHCDELLKREFDVQAEGFCSE